MPTVQKWNDRKQRYNILAVSNTLSAALIAVKNQVGLRIRMKVHYSTNQPLCITRRWLAGIYGVRIGRVLDTNYHERFGYSYLVGLLDNSGYSQYENESNILASNKPMKAGIDYSWYDQYTYNFDG